LKYKLGKGSKEERLTPSTKGTFTTHIPRKVSSFVFIFLQSTEMITSSSSLDTSLLRKTEKREKKKARENDESGRTRIEKMRKWHSQVRPVLPDWVLRVIFRRIDDNFILVTLNNAVNLEIPGVTKIISGQFWRSPEKRKVERGRI